MPREKKLEDPIGTQDLASMFIGSAQEEQKRVEKGVGEVR